MDETQQAPQTTFGWMRRHRRGIAVSMLGFWFLPLFLVLAAAHGSRVASIRSGSPSAP